MDDASSEVLSEPSSDRTVRPVQHPQSVDARESETFPTANAETKNKVASEANAAAIPSANTTDDLSQIGIEIVANTLVDRARILLLLRNRSKAFRCFEDALEHSGSSNNEGLQQKCRVWLQQFRDGLGICHPLIGRTATLSRLSEEEGAVSDLELMLRLATKYNFEFPYWVVDQATAGSQPLSARPGPVLPPAAQPGDNLGSASSSLPPTKVDLMIAGLRDPSVRQRRQPQQRPLSLAQSPGPTSVNKQAVRAFGSNPPSSDLKSARQSELLGRDREHLPSPQARDPPPSATQQRRHSSLVGEEVTMVGSWPQPGKSLDLSQNLRFEVGSTGSVLTTDTPALTRLAETINANPSPQSESSVATGIHRRPSILYAHASPSLAIKTSGFYLASAPDSTVPHNHSPLREAFVPDPDPVDDAASDASAKVQLSTELCSSSEILEEPTNKPYDLDRDKFYAHQVRNDNVTNLKPVPSDDVRSLVAVDHGNSDATVREQGRRESAEVTDPASNKSNIDTKWSNEQHLGRDSDAIVISQIKQKIANLKAEKQKQSAASGKPEEQTNGLDLHHQSSGTDSNSSAASVSTTVDIDSVASDKIPTDETKQSISKDDDEAHDPGHAQIEALLAESVKHQILDPSEKYFTMHPDETMTEQDRLDAERVINVILHEAILDMTPDIVMDEYLKYQLKKDGAAGGQSRLESADCAE